MRDRSFEGMEPLESRRVLAAVFWDGGGGDLSWHNPLNWSADVLPGPEDDVTVAAAGTPTIALDQPVETSIRSLTSSERLRLSAGTLSVALLWRQAAGLEVSGGRVTGAGNLQLTGPVDWSGGEIGGTGRLQVLSPGLLNIEGDVLLSRDLVNGGAVSWGAGEIDARGVRIYNLAGHAFVAASAGALLSGGAPSLFINGGTLAREGDPATSTAIQIEFNPQGGPAGQNGGVPFGPTPGVVDVRSGRLRIEGVITGRSGASLAGGHWWVTSGDAELLIPGPELIAITSPSGEESAVVLRGAGASFPAIENIRSMRALTLSGGRAFTFGAIDAPFDRLILANPGVTVLPTPLSARMLEVQSGTVQGSLSSSEAMTIEEGATLHITGVMEVGPGSVIAGPGLLRVSGTLVIRGGILEGGPVLVTTAGTMRIQTEGGGTARLGRRVVNYGELRWTGDGELLLGAELVNRGMLALEGFGGISTGGAEGGPAPALIQNFGTLSRAGAGNMTLRAAGGGVRLNQQGSVTVQSGRLNLYGGVLGGGFWTVSAGAELAFGGADAALEGASIAAPGLIRVAARLLLEDTLVSDSGDMVVGAVGRLELRGDSQVSRALTTNLGTVFQDEGYTLFSGTLSNTGTLLVGPGSMALGSFICAPSSTLRIRSASAESTGTLAFSGATQLAGSLVVDFGWSPALGEEIQIYYADWFWAGGDFASVQATGLPPNRTLEYFTYSYRTTIFGSVRVVAGA